MKISLTNEKFTKLYNEGRLSILIGISSLGTLFDECNNLFGNIPLYRFNINVYQHDES